MTDNPCIRCGKQRIVLREWKEKITTLVGVSLVVHTQTVCPDQTCQKLVEEKQEAERLKQDEIKRQFEERAVAKREERGRLRLAKKAPKKK